MEPLFEVAGIQVVQSLNLLPSSTGTHDMQLPVFLPGHANPERQCPRGLEKKMLNQSLRCYADTDSPSKPSTALLCT